MTIGSQLNLATKQLENGGLPTGRLDTLILLEDITGKDRAWLLANPQAEILPHQMTKLNKLLSRRAQHEPLAYIRGKVEFYGRQFIITDAVLVPRPETEAMVDLLKQLIQSQGLEGRSLSIADVGTGSGALGITAALEVPSSHVELLEVDLQATQVAKMNVDKFTLDIKVTKSDLLNKTHSKYDILLCNLPYVPDDYEINRAAKHEPTIALYGGPDGLDLYRRLFLEISQRPSEVLYILSEALPSQHQELSLIARKYGYVQLKSYGYVQLFQRSELAKK